MIACDYLESRPSLVVITLASPEGDVFVRDVFIRESIQVGLLSAAETMRKLALIWTSGRVRAGGLVSSRYPPAPLGLKGYYWVIKHW